VPYSDAVSVVRDAENGPDIAYHLGKNPAEALPERERPFKIAGKTSQRRKCGKEPMLFDVEPQTCLNSTVAAKGTSRLWSSTPGENLPQNRSLDRLAAPAIVLTLRRTSLSRRGELYEVALDSEVIVSSSRDPEYDACRELLKRGLRGIAVFRRPGAAPHFLGRC
jgi:hypothetical protein